MWTLIFSAHDFTILQTYSGNTPPSHIGHGGEAQARLDAFEPSTQPHAALGPDRVAPIHADCPPATTVLAYSSALLPDCNPTTVPCHTHA
jgi:hypothetical protein